MTEQSDIVWFILRYMAPIAMFVIVFFLCLSIFTLPIVLSVVLASLAGIVEWASINWIYRRVSQKR